MSVLALVWPLVLPRGAVDAAATVEIELAAHFVAEPLSIAPDVTWGVTDRLTLGAITSGRSLPRVQAGDGLCVHGCDRIYDNAGVEARWGFDARVAAHARLVFRSFSPVKPSLRPGVLVRWTHGPIAIDADPQLWLGLANRDQGNAAEISVPIWLRVELGARAEAWLFTGVRGELSGFAEKYAIPVAVGAAALVGDGFAVGGEFGIPQLLGPQNQVSSRSAYLFVERRVP